VVDATGTVSAVGSVDEAEAGVVNVVDSCVARFTEGVTALALGVCTVALRFFGDAAVSPFDGEAAATANSPSASLLQPAPTKAAKAGTAGPSLLNRTSRVLSVSKLTYVRKSSTEKEIVTIER